MRTSDPTRTAAKPAEPPLRWYLTEPARGAAEWARLPLALPWMARAPRGDGHGVLVLPGLLATDTSTVPLRRFLRVLGYDARGWELGRNGGPTARVLAGLRDALHGLAAETDAAVSVVGWSLGGIYAREMARLEPDLVRRVVTLGSPYAMSHPRQSRASRTYQRRSRRHVPGQSAVDAARRQPLDVPSTAVFSKRDGIVAWRACMSEATALHDNVEVTCAHLGFGVDPATLWVVADRLAQPAGVQEPFRPPRFFPARFPRRR